MDVVIPPSARLLLLCLASSAMCALALTALSVTLLAIWRHPSRPWRLGVGALIAGTIAVIAAGRTLGAYNDLKNISTCYSSGCYGWYPWITHATIAAGVFAGTLALCTVVAIIGAIVLTATESPTHGVHAMQAGNWLSRWFPIAFAAVFIEGAAYWTAEGIAHWIQFAYLTAPGAAGDGLGLLPLYGAIIQTICGAGFLGLTVGILWRLVSRRADEPQPQPSPGLNG